MMTENVATGMYIVPVMENFLEIVVISQNWKDVNYLNLLQYQLHYILQQVLVSDLAVLVYGENQVVCFAPWIIV